MRDRIDLSPKALQGLFQGLSSIKIRRSALSPFLSACLYITLPCCIIATIYPGPLQYFVFTLGAIPIGLFSIASIYLLVNDPERLHTEEHLERKYAMDIVESKGEGLILDPVDLVDMVNPSPEFRKLPPPEEKTISVLPDKVEVTND